MPSHDYSNNHHPLPNFIIPHFSILSPKLHSSSNISTRKIFQKDAFLSCLAAWISLLGLGLSVALFFEIMQIQFYMDTTCTVSNYSPIIHANDLFFFKANITWDGDNQNVIDQFCASDLRETAFECMNRSTSSPYACIVLQNPIYSVKILTSYDYSGLFNKFLYICTPILVLCALISISLIIFKLSLNSSNPVVSVNWDNPHFKCFYPSELRKGFAQEKKTSSDKRDCEQLTCELMVGEEIQLYEHIEGKIKNLFFIGFATVCLFISMIVSSIAAFFPILPALVLCILLVPFSKVFEEHFHFNEHYLLTNRRIIIFRPRLFTNLITCVELSSVKRAWVNGDVVETFGLMVKQPVDVCVEFQDGERGILLNGTIASGEYLNRINNEV